MDAGRRVVCRKIPGRRINVTIVIYDIFRTIFALFNYYSTISIINTNIKIVTKQDNRFVFIIGKVIFFMTYNIIKYNS